MFCSAVHDRRLPTGLADLETPVPTRLRAATRSHQTAIDNLTHATERAAYDTNLTQPPNTRPKNHGIDDLAFYAPA